MRQKRAGGESADAGKPHRIGAADAVAGGAELCCFCGKGAAEPVIGQERARDAGIGAVADGSPAHYCRRKVIRHIVCLLHAGVASGKTAGRLIP